MLCLCIMLRPWIMLAVFIVVVSAILVLYKFFENQFFGWLDRRFGRAQFSRFTSRDRLPYASKDYLLTIGEAVFFKQLQSAVAGRYVAIIKVRLADLIHVKQGTGAWRHHFNRIAAKHADFVLLEAQSLRPLLAIELDDRSHEAPERKDRDDFVNAALLAAGLPLLRIKAARAYSPVEIAKQIEQALTPKPS